IVYPNYPAFAADGRLYVTDSGGWKSNDGSILCIEPGGRTTRVGTPPLLFPNGLAMLDDWLYVVESTLPGITRVRRDGSNRETVLMLDRAIPDGIAFDADGGLWIGCWQPNRILRLSPTGSLDVIADDWSGIEVLTPNNLAFAGPDLAELAFPALGGNFVRAFRPGVRGRPLHYPKVSP
ncbi:MAG: SMP-30/gluconolactonase/LRE family protein, partial [Rhizobiaceae bacterium]|nr:SMP-30/gluconolactonase/LRE family protein [Rhizobiaceae bacterium]